VAIFEQCLAGALGNAAMCLAMQIIGLTARPTSSTAA
jgi:hypothetical protein